MEDIGKSNSLRASAASVRTVDQFREWTKTCLRPILPHESFLCGFGRMHAGGVGLDYIIAVDFPMEHLQAIRNRAGAIDTPVLRRWLASSEPVFLDAANPWPEIDAKWLESFRTSDLRNVAAHALLDAERCVGTYHSLYRIPHAPDIGYLQTLRDAVPVLHELFCRIIDSLRADDRISERLAKLNEREHEIVGWVGMGKTNSEIAQIIDMSESTIKHRLSDIFDKLGMSNRAQLARCLADCEARRLHGQTTRVL